MDKFKGYRTVAFFVLFALVQLAGIVGFADYTPGTDLAEAVSLVVAFIAVILRLVTDTPAGQHA